MPFDDWNMMPSGVETTEPGSAVPIDLDTAWGWLNEPWPLSFGPSPLTTQIDVSLKAMSRPSSDASARMGPRPSPSRRIVRSGLNPMPRPGLYSFEYQSSVGYSALTTQSRPPFASMRLQEGGQKFSRTLPVE